MQNLAVQTNCYIIETVLLRRKIVDRTYRPILYNRSLSWHPVTTENIFDSPVYYKTTIENDKWACLSDEPVQKISNSLQL